MMCIYRGHSQVSIGLYRNQLHSAVASLCPQLLPFSAKGTKGRQRERHNLLWQVLWLALPISTLPLTFSIFLSPLFGFFWFWSVLAGASPTAPGSAIQEQKDQALIVTIAHCAYVHQITNLINQSSNQSSKTSILWCGRQTNAENNAHRQCPLNSDFSHT